MGKYDIPAVLNYILAKTGRDKLIYIGHSMGTTMFWVAMETHPELNQKIQLMVCSSIGNKILINKKKWIKFIFCKKKFKFCKFFKNLVQLHTLLLLLLILENFN